MRKLIVFLVSLAIVAGPFLVRKPDPNCTQTKKFECVSWCMSLNCGPVRRK